MSLIYRERYIWWPYRSVTCRDNAHTCRSIFYDDLWKSSKVGQGDLFLLCDHGSLVDMCTQDYKSLCASVTICATLVNTQTHAFWTISLKLLPVSIRAMFVIVIRLPNCLVTRPIVVGGHMFYCDFLFFYLLFLFVSYSRSSLNSIFYNLLSFAVTSLRFV